MRVLGCYPPPNLKNVKASLCLSTYVTYVAAEMEALSLHIKKKCVTSYCTPLDQPPPSTVYAAKTLFTKAASDQRRR